MYYLLIPFISFTEAVKYAFHEKDENRKKDLYKDIIETAAPLYLGKLDAIAKANGGYIALGKVGFLNIFNDFMCCSDSFDFTN